MAHTNFPLSTELASDRTFSRCVGKHTHRQIVTVVTGTIIKSKEQKERSSEGAKCEEEMVRAKERLLNPP